MFYAFVKRQWTLGKIDEAGLQSFVPTFITQAQADEIKQLQRGE